MNPLTIRLASHQDLPEITRLNQELFNYEQQFDTSYNLNWPSSEAGQKYFQDSLKEGIILIAQNQDSQIVAYLCGNWDTYSFRTVNPIFEIENMFVQKNYQQQGIGTLLVQHLEKLLKEKNIQHLRVATLQKNQAARNFYLKNSFQNHELVLEKNI